ncbi:MAG: phage terminase large subunit [Elusimicrobiaceae bacterium]|nr:phage terminase large subunit [Elusimicrobiaceae bacterium]
MPNELSNKNERQLLRAVLRSDFKSFCIKVFNEVSGSSVYQDNWHVDVICQSIENIRCGNETRLIINVPPRYMKSIICSVALPAFLLGHNPKERILCVSYSDELAAKMASDQRKIMEREWYQELFPFTRLLRRGVMDLETTAGGGRFSTSVGGTITGRGGNWIIIDDPIKPADAYSDVVRNKVNDWYGNTLLSRLDDKKNGKILAIMQRTHINDLTGHLLETDSSFRLIKMPAIAIKDETWSIGTPYGEQHIIERPIGEALHHTRESVEDLQRIKSTAGSYTFASQYQQTPELLGGNIIRREWLHTYKVDELHKQVRTGKLKLSLCQSWDTASKAEEDNDYSVCITYAHDYRKTIWIIDVFRAKLEFPDLVETATYMARECQQKYRSLNPYIPDILIEDMNSGIGLAQTLANSFGSNVKPIKPTQDKATRLKTVSYLLETGKCLFPDNNPTWWPDFERELLQFPNGRHDDQCDALSQLLTYEQQERKDLSWLEYV